MGRIIENIDVICQHKADGDIIPLRFRLKNEDGEYEVYKISDYRNLAHPGEYTTPDGIMVTGNVFVFECRVIILDYKKLVRLYFDRGTCRWKIAI